MDRMTSFRPHLLLLTAICLAGASPLHAALPPGPATDADAEAEPATAPPLSQPLEPPSPKPAPAPAAATTKPPQLPPPLQQPPKPATPAPAPVQNVAAGGILGRTVVGPDSQAIGRVVDVLVDAASNPRAAVIDFGGFMGVGSRRIAVNWSDLSFPPVTPSGQSKDIKLDLTAEQIMTAPEYTDQTKPASVVEPPPASSKLAKPEAATGH